MRYAIFILLLASIAQAKTLKVMVIDTGIANHQKLNKYIAINTENPDVHGHGTNIAGTIIYGKNISNPDTVCDDVVIIPCNVWDGFNMNIEQSNKCIERAIKERIEIINYSGGGVEKSETEKELILEYLKIGKMNVAAGNGEEKMVKIGDMYIREDIGYDLTKKKYYPASYQIDNPNFSVVGATENGLKTKGSNYGLNNMVWRSPTSLSTFLNNEYQYMSGTSQATALYTHDLAKEFCEGVDK